MKKLLALVLVAVMAFSCVVLASCSDKEESSAASTTSDASTDTSSASADESTASADESTASADESTASADESTESADESEAPAEIPEEVKATAAYKAIDGIDAANGISAKLGMLGMDISVYIFGENISMAVSMEVEGELQSTKVILKDGKAYSIDDATKTYFVSDADEMTDMGMTLDMIPTSAEKVFAGHTFVSASTEEIEGVTFTVETFKAEDQEIKYYLDAEGNLKLMSTMGMVIPYEMAEGVPEGCFDIPADYTEAVDEPMSDEAAE